MIYKFSGKGAFGRLADLAERLYPEVFYLHEFRGSRDLCEVRAWCYEQFGYPAYAPSGSPAHKGCEIVSDCIWMSFEDEFRFKNTILATAFKLRWL